MADATAPADSSASTAAAPPAAAAANADSPFPFVGARIDLISNLDIRYEGILYTVDSVEQSVALQQVRCYGTENRVDASKFPDRYVPPSSDCYEFIVFRGSDIKDLSLHDSAPSTGFPKDPAIVQSALAPPAPPPMPPMISSPYAPPPAYPPSPAGYYAPPYPRNPADEDDFDFERSNTRFNKNEFVHDLVHDVQEHDPAAAAHASDAAASEGDPDEEATRRTLESLHITPAYNKTKSFFDDLSVGNAPSGPPLRSALAAHHPTSDRETFGDLAENAPRGRGRGRGQRGRNFQQSQRGRRYNNNNNNNNNNSGSYNNNYGNNNNNNNNNNGNYRSNSGYRQHSDRQDQHQYRQQRQYNDDAPAAAPPAAAGPINSNGQYTDSQGFSAYVAPSLLQQRGRGRGRGSGNGNWRQRGRGRPQQQSSDPDA